ncbi:diadenosine tetraphosphate (Ap4A) HIT family hydrolase [Actimicrobium sp. GrIS 1.19]|uniref:HIT family protein n=1 Tax=Actimicrobium sp. GrIS 1.19 TaxID=3071708 RepID=UPI002DFF08A4|nr:diadenosine tetraphosphate (Ap4A) HIT family hydrolase [Actimicrobium sp. GrIS 1.19]
MDACELCRLDGGEVVVRTAQLRIVLVDDAQYPGFCRVIWNTHLAEMTDLVPAERSTLMAAVCKVEATLREVMAPHKVNLASLGNMVPHLHWHVIPRFTDDAHFPAPIWAAVVRVTPAQALAERLALLPALRTALLRNFNV